MRPMRPVLLARMSRGASAWKTQETNKIKSERRRADPEAPSRQLVGEMRPSSFCPLSLDACMFSPHLPHKQSEHALRETSLDLEE